MRVMGHWHRFPNEVVDIQSLKTFKLDVALNNLIWLKIPIH